MRTSDITVLSTHAVQEVLAELQPSLERAGGMRLTIDYDPANALKRRIEEGTAFDVAIVTRLVIDALAGRGKVRRETCTDIARSGLGIAVRRGAAKPDIANRGCVQARATRRQSVARSKEGTSGLYFETLLTGLGIAEAMRGKIVSVRAGA